MLNISRETRAYVMIGGLSLPVGFILLLNFLLDADKSVVIPMYRKELPRAWYLSDELKVAVLTAIVTAVLTAVITLAFVRG
jgi:hypothetical protein